MKIKVYTKKGNTNYKEKKLIAKIEEAIGKRLESDADLANNFSPATNFEELQQLHDKYCIEDANIVSETVKGKTTEYEGEETTTHEDFRKGMEETVQQPHIDPLNAEEPIIRDYVMEEEYADKNKTQQQTNNTFDEPVSFNDAFQIPQDENQEQNNVSSDNTSERKEKKKEEKPFNPDFNDMSKAKKEKSTKRFARNIVETVCTLAEKGFVWYANKDINDAKIAEYEMNGEIDTTLLLQMDGNQEQTVRAFFQTQCNLAIEAGKIDQASRDELAENLYAVFLEKGIAPTPMQELAMTTLKIFGGQAIMLFSIRAQTNSVLTQLREMNANNVERGYQRHEANMNPNYQTQQEAQPQPQEETTKVESEVKVTDPIEEETGVILTPKNTKE